MFDYDSYDDILAALASGEGMPEPRAAQELDVSTTTAENDVLLDLSTIEYSSPGTWKSVIEAMSSGNAVLVSRSVAIYFLEVLPPRWLPCAGCFAFCEGDDRYAVFVAVGGGPWLMKTLPYGERDPALLDTRVRELRAQYARHQLATPRSPVES